MSQSDRTDAYQAFTSYPLVTALQGRRSRRFAAGAEIPDGPLAYQSNLAPQPLDDVERAVLVMCAIGLTGWTTGMEHTTVGTPNTGCNYPDRLGGHTRPSAAGIGTSEILVTHDGGTFLTQFRDLTPEETSPILPSQFDTLPDLIRRHSVQLLDRRVDVPRIPPMISAHNVWNANVPGSTLFAPIVDLTEQLIEFLFVYLGSGFMPWDSVAGRPCGNPESAIRAGLIDTEKKFSIQQFEQYVVVTGGVEHGLMGHNAVLALQAMGLGGWMFTGIDPPTLLGARAPAGIPGAEFEFVTARDGTPGCVGLAKYFETYCPPWYGDMRQAVDAFVERKFGGGGTYDPSTPGPWADNRATKERVDRYRFELVDAVAGTAEYLYATYGQFPSTAPPAYARIYFQAHHLDLEFYEEKYGPEFLLDTHRAHERVWHSG